MMANNTNNQEVKHKGMLFINDEGYSLHFVICIKDTGYRDELKETLETHLACVSTDFNDVGPHSIILVDSSSRNHEKLEVFKIGYIRDCLERTRILDVSKYLWSQSNIYRSNFDYMDVVYYRKYTWDTIPAKYLLQKDEEEDDIIIESDPDEEDSFCNSVHSTPYSRRNTSSKKNTRNLYTRKEKEAIVQYIVSRSLYRHVKGNEIWRKMEDLNICPIRTWQSMKEHFRKVISKELNSFSSLTPKQKQRLLDNSS